MRRSQLAVMFLVICRFLFSLVHGLPGIYLSAFRTTGTKERARTIFIRLSCLCQHSNFNVDHMEQNIYRALQDIPTITELCVLSLYAQSIGHPYLRQVRGPDKEHANILMLGPLHERSKPTVQPSSHIRIVS
jgi:hypothetical protein